MDFGENYACHHQDEAQGAHWHYEQVTLHPIVTYYHCPTDGCNEIVHESVIFISNDHKHDYHAVQYFVKKTNQYLLEQRLNICKEILFSDGAPTQYKSKANFLNLSMSKEDYGFDIEKHFFGSRHGKGPCDGEVGVLKRSASLAVKRGQVISDAEDFYKFAKDTLSLPKSSVSNDIATHTHAKRTFIKVNEGEISREQARLKDIKCIPQTRSTHQYRGIQPYIVTVRERSCFCEECVIGEGTCQNEHIVGRWNVHNLKIKRRAGKIKLLVIYTEHVFESAFLI